MILSFQRLGLGKILFVVLAIGFLVTALWGISQSKTLLSENQLKSITGGASVSLTPLEANWRPRYSSSSTANITANITVNIANYTDSGYVIFSLSNVTSFPGYSMNWGNQTTSDKDLKLNKEDQDGEGLIWTGGGQSIKVSWNQDFSKVHGA